MALYGGSAPLSARDWFCEILFHDSAYPSGTQVLESMPTISKPSAAPALDNHSRGACALSLVQFTAANPKVNL